MMLVISTFYIYQRIPKLIMLLFLRLLPEVSTWEEISLSILMQNQFSLCTDMMHYFRDVIQYFFLLMWRIQVRRKYSIRYSETTEGLKIWRANTRGSCLMGISLLRFLKHSINICLMQILCYLFHQSDFFGKI